MLKKTSISHNIFLNEEQRYAIAGHYDSKKGLNVVGTTLKVCFKGNDTDEPAKEIFCLYNIKHTDGPIEIIKNNNGFSIKIPDSGSLLNYKDFRGSKSFIRDEIEINSVFHTIAIWDLQEVSNSFFDIDS